jgi:hypothetical protein
MSPKQLKTEDAKTLVSLRMEIRYRNQLARISNERRVSLNQLMLDAVEKEYPPDGADRGD